MKSQSPLTKEGYCMVVLPKTDIFALGLLYQMKDGIGTLNAQLDQFFDKNKEDMPEAQKGKVPDIAAAGEMDFDAKVSVSLLNSLLEKWGLGKASVKGNIDVDYSISATFTNVQREFVNLPKLDYYINDAKPIYKKFNSYKDKLEHNEMFVISEILKTSFVTIKIAAKNGADMSTDVTFKGILGTHADMARKVSNSIALDYKDEQNPLVFALKAQQIIYDRGSFWSGRPASFKIIEKSGENVLDKGEIPTRPLETGDELLDI